MKFYETHFEEYILSNQKINLHPKLEDVFNNFPNTIQNLKNLIFYGPQGVGKYTQVLRTIKKYSPSELKYEKKISITYNKTSYYFKISDIHYEIDMSLLGCNSKLLWNEIYQQIIDIISTKPNKTGIILCKYFHHIHSELLDNFYSYMQHNAKYLDLKYILITEEISFIPDNIINCCEIVNISRPTKTLYNKCLKNKIFKEKNMKLENITNIKNFHNTNSVINEENDYKIVCNKIINSMKNINDFNFLKFRDLLYELLIFNLDITHCIWYIHSNIINEKLITDEDIPIVLIKMYVFFQYYNNNSRPIYHLENYFINLIILIQKYKEP